MIDDLTMIWLFISRAVKACCTKQKNLQMSLLLGNFLQRLLEATRNYRMCLVFLESYIPVQVLHSLH